MGAHKIYGVAPVATIRNLERAFFVLFVNRLAFRASCVARGLATRLKDANPNDVSASSARCSVILFVTTEEKSFHEVLQTTTYRDEAANRATEVQHCVSIACCLQEGYGTMLLKLERLLALACLAGRTLVIPSATYGVLSKLIDLPALEAAGFCFVPANGSWQVRTVLLAFRTCSSAWRNERGAQLVSTFVLVSTKHSGLRRRKRHRWPGVPQSEAIMMAFRGSWSTKRRWRHLQPSLGSL